VAHFTGPEAKIDVHLSFAVLPYHMSLAVMFLKGVPTPQSLIKYSERMVTYLRRFIPAKPFSDSVFRSHPRYVGMFLFV
jgi:hypothetical protein